jgi:membrane-associated phospholipid phosphatase
MLKDVKLENLKQMPDYGLWGLACLTMLLMIGIDQVDRQWTLFLHQHEWPFLTNMMNRTVFKGSWIGDGDLSILFLIFVVFFYILACIKHDTPSLTRWRPHLGFIVIAAFMSCLGSIHTLKWILGRARPSLVLSNQLPYTHWFEFGPHFVTQGIYRGSFPGGHTALSFIFMSLAYALAGDIRHCRNTRYIGVCVGIFAVINALLMCIARSMSLSHWVSDSLASILLSWITIHILYVHVLDLPSQGRANANRRFNVNVPPFWELNFCFNLFIMLLGVLACMFGLRALIRHEGIYWMALIPSGVVIALIFWNRIKSLHRIIKVRCC